MIILCGLDMCFYNGKVIIFVLSSNKSCLGFCVNDCGRLQTVLARPMHQLY